MLSDPHALTEATPGLNSRSLGLCRDRWQARWLASLAYSAPGSTTPLGSLHYAPRAAEAEACLAPTAAQGWGAWHVYGAGVAWGIGYSRYLQATERFWAAQALNLALAVAIYYGLREAVARVLQ